MSKWIKGFFKKELTSIIAPLDKIHTKLENFLDQAGLDIANKLKQINDLSDKITLHKAEQETATLIKTNISKLIGK